MGQDERDIVRQILEEASDAPHWFDLSDAERLTLMILMAFRKGCENSEEKNDDRRTSEN